MEENENDRQTIGEGAVSEGHPHSKKDGPRKPRRWKRCIECGGIKKSKKNFSENEYTPDGLKGYCKVCEKKKDKEKTKEVKS